jgi:hypothetical protein
LVQWRNDCTAGTVAEVTIMTNYSAVNVGCKLIGQFVDESESQVESHRQIGRNALLCQVVEFIDEWVHGDTVKDFTVLLKDNRSVVVRGNVLKVIPPMGTESAGAYGIAIRAGEKESLIAVFKTLEVIGIYTGELRLERKTA